MNRHVHRTTGKYLLVYLFIIFGSLFAGCSKVNISNLHTQAAPDMSATELASLHSFALLPLDMEEPFSEQLALDAVSDNLLARGYRQDSHSPDFLVAVWFDQTYQAESHIAPGYPVHGWYSPGFGRYRHHWPGYGHYLRSGSYTVINNYMVMAIAFVKPGSLATIKQNQSSPETVNAVPAADILWLGQAHTKSNRNAFTTLSCLAAGILEEYPNSSPGSAQNESRGIELTRCY